LKYPVFYMLALVLWTGVTGGKVSAAEVISVTPFYVQIDAGAKISQEHLLWFPVAPSVQEFSKELITFDPTGFKKANRYGDRLGRLITADDQWLAEYWVRQGRAVYNGLPYPKEWRDILLKAEHQARKAQLGYWQKYKILDANNPPEISKQGHFKIFEGQVREARAHRGTIYLNFGSDWRSDFTAAVSPQNKRIFKKKGWKLADLSNKWIRIRGFIRSYNGPYMELTNPEQLELLEKQ
jgi:Staphylococcal nuclease homologue